MILKNLLIFMIGWSMGSETYGYLCGRCAIGLFLVESLLERKLASLDILALFEFIPDIQKKN